VTPEVETILASLSDIQREAVVFQEGAALVLAGPGSGKTRVLTARIARILDATRDRKFRLLALTFTTKAAMEMRERVEALVPGLTERTFIGTFHAFCTQLLRQHGSHLGMSPDFAIFDQDVDRVELLEDALAEAEAAGSAVTTDDVRWLKTIDPLKSRLILPEKAAERFRDPKAGANAAKVYEIYEAALRSRNSMDFNGLILGACRMLRDVPGVAERVRQSYPYWLIDEFQDTTPAQYRLLTLAAGDTLKNVFAVADDDQIIYQWAGASYRQIERLRADFKPHLIQLVENHRCPPAIVTAANKLVAHNTFRTPEKEPIVAAKRDIADAISIRILANEADEQQFVADAIAASPPISWGSTAVLGRTRAMLLPVQQALQAKGIKAAVAQRRDRFISPEFNWLQACLHQALRPNDVRTFRLLVDSANRVVGAELDADILVAESEAKGTAYIEHWASAAVAGVNEKLASLGDLAGQLARSRTQWRQVVRAALPILVEGEGGQGILTDAADDRAAWEACLKEIRAEKGSELDLDEVIQGLALRSKEPPRDPDAVTLMTVHASKGLEFDSVYVVGLAESVMPSWQSVQQGDSSAEMEEERRNCFVAITRTCKHLTLSYATNYRGWNKAPSRFLAEMDLPTIIGCA
jgi:DNA helicase-2/ATP-dependent DNA helicase PcrA